jgi:hypothetical protein
MYRSGSTWLFNVARIVATLSLGNVGSGTPDDESLAGFENLVLKTHPFNQREAESADLVLISHRDIRDVVASCHRKMNRELSLDVAKEAMEQYFQWLPHACYDMHYESMIQDPKSEAKKIVQAIGLPVDYEKVAEEVSSICFRDERKSKSKPHDLLTLLHPNHITDGRHGSWKGLLPAKTALEIEKEFSSWMKEKGYL